MKKIVTWHSKLKPVKLTPGSLCWDLKAAEDVIIKPGEIKVIKLGIKTNFAWKLYSRSSLPIKKGLIIANGIGIIDEDFRHEASIILYNPNSENVEVKFGYRVAQMEILGGDEEIEILVNEELFNKWENIYPTKRRGGLGSTGGYNG